MSSGEVVGVIPARMASSRFPGKPLAPIADRPMVEHVYRRAALASSIDRLLVATPDAEIAEAVSSFGGEPIMTSDRHERCTDRVAEVAARIEPRIVLNIQGDEPLVRPEMIDAVVAALDARPEIGCCNLLVPIATEQELQDPNRVKAALSPDKRILYYSRAPIPYGDLDAGGLRLRQVGLLAFSSEYLSWFMGLPPTPLQQLESIDMLSALESGREVLGEVVERTLLCVDRPEDIAPVERELASDDLVAGYR